MSVFFHKAYDHRSRLHKKIQGCVDFWPESIDKKMRRNFGELKILKLKSDEIEYLPFFQIRIGVKFCALNLYDYNYMWGKCAPTLPFIPGSEVSGVVLEVGQKCTRGFQVGDKVFALPG